MFKSSDDVNGTPRELVQPIFLKNERCIIHDGRTRVFINGEQQRLTNRGVMVQVGKKYGLIELYTYIEDTTTYSLTLANGAIHSLPTLTVTVYDVTQSTPISEIENLCDHVFTIYRR